MVDVTDISYEQAVEVLRRNGLNLKALERVRGAARMLTKKLEPVNPNGNQFGAELEALRDALSAAD